MFPQISGGRVNGGVAKTVTSFRVRALPSNVKAAPRVGHTFIVVEDDFLIFGGRTANGQHPNALLGFSTRTLEWEQVRTLGAVPAGRTNHTAVLAKKRILVYGGNRFQEVFDDLCALDLSTLRWERIFGDTSQSPGPLFGHAAVYVEAVETLYVVGGYHTRQHNVHLVHAFCDGRHRAWKRIRGPSSVDARQLRQVVVAFFAPKSSLVVLGWDSGRASVQTRLGRHPGEMMPNNSADVLDGQQVTTRGNGAAATAGGGGTPGVVYMMNVYTQVWTTVTTTSSPETPISFHFDSTWALLLSHLYTMSEHYDSELQEWFFPLYYHSGDIQPPAGGASLGKVRAQSIFGPGPPKLQYGFFKLQMATMSWSIVPLIFPKGMVSESGLLESGAQSGRAGRVYAYNWTSASGPSSLAPPVEPLMQSVQGARDDAAQLPVFSPRGVVAPYERKYALAARLTRVKGKRGMDFMIMHGGLETNQQALLFLSPVIRKVNAPSPLGDGADNARALLINHGADDEDDEKSVNLFEHWLTDGSTRLSTTSSLLLGSTLPSSATSSVIGDDLGMDSGGPLRAGDEHEPRGGVTALPLSRSSSSRSSAVNPQGDMPWMTGATGPFLSASRPPVSRPSSGALGRPFDLLRHPRNCNAAGSLADNEERSCPIVHIPDLDALGTWVSDFYGLQRQWLAERLHVMEQQHATHGKGNHDGEGSSEGDGADGELESGNTATSAPDPRRRRQKKRGAGKKTQRKKSSKSGKAPARGQERVSPSGDVPQPVTSLGSVTPREPATVLAHSAKAEARRSGGPKVREERNFFAAKGFTDYDDLLAAYEESRENDVARDPSVGLDLHFGEGVVGTAGGRRVHRFTQLSKMLPEGVFGELPPDGGCNTLVTLRHLSGTSREAAIVAARYLLARAVAAITARSPSAISYGERRRLIAQRRWAYLRVMTTACNAAYVLQKKNDETAKYRCTLASTASGVLFAPELVTVMSASAPPQGDPRAPSGEPIANRRARENGGATLVRRMVEKVRIKHVTYRIPVQPALGVSFLPEKSHNGAVVYRIRRPVENLK